jgi:hypothetical protein
MSSSVMKRLIRGCDVDASHGADVKETHDSPISIEITSQETSTARLLSS